MKVIYLKSLTEQDLKDDLLTVFPEWNGTDMDFSNGQCHGHYIGRIIQSADAEGNVTWKEGYHANCLVPDDFEYEWLTRYTPDPQTPDHVFLGWEPVPEDEVIE